MHIEGSQRCSGVRTSWASSDSCQPRRRRRHLLPRDLVEATKVPAVAADTIVVAAHTTHQFVRTAKDVQIFELEHNEELQTDLDNI